MAGKTSEQAKVNLKANLPFLNRKRRANMGDRGRFLAAEAERPSGVEQDALSFLDRRRQEEKIPEGLPRRRGSRY